MSRFKTVSEGVISGEVENLCEAFKISCAHNNVAEHDFDYFKRYVFFLFTILRIEMNTVNAKLATTKKPAKKKTAKKKTKGAKNAKRTR